MEKLLIITPHMSTGGCPQVVLKRIELLKNNYDIYCVEYSFLSPDYVVQRNKVEKILGSNFLSLGENKKQLIDIIIRINPDIIFIEEISETFIDLEVCKFIYKDNRNYKVFESTHGSDDKSYFKKFLPDKFVFVSKWSQNQYERFNIPIDVIEYPVDKKSKYNLEYELFDKEYKHILNIGLFTPGKNQKYIFDIAKEMVNEKVKFHFVGNLAPNFEHYWRPIIENKTDNCIIWGEKNNTEDFLISSDLFLFTSRFELNPLVIKESLEFEIPTLMFNLETYCGNYNDIESISFLTGNISEDIKKIKDILYA